jgi:WD40 repeat protein
MPPDNSGIHFISFNETRTCFACSSANPNEIALFDALTLKPSAVLAGHSGWAFQAQFVGDRIFSAGRDSLVCVWRITGTQQIVRPSASRLEHLDKVRDLQIMRSQQNFVTTSHDRTIRVWDLNNLDVVKSYSCGSVLEISCMAVDERLDLVAVGSRRHLHLVDRRSPKPISHQSCRTDHEGVRSLSIVGSSLCCGTGRGYFGFFDRRAMTFRDVSPDRPDLRVGNGYVRRDTNFAAYFADVEPKTAVYAHCWQPNSNVLFMAGGPLPVGMSGAYAAVWS